MRAEVMIRPGKEGRERIKDKVRGAGGAGKKKNRERSWGSIA